MKNVVFSNVKFYLKQHVPNHPKVIKHTFYLPISNMIDLPYDANPRLPTSKSPISNKMKETLMSENNSFELLNLGISLIVKECFFNKNNVTVRLGKNDGVFNGGHTHMVCMQALKTNKFMKNQHVMIHIYEGLQENKEILTNMVKAHNKTSAVDTASFMNYTNSFNDIKKTLKPNYLKLISFKKNDGGTIEVARIFQLLESLIRVSNKSKTNIYTAKAITMQNFNKEKIQKFLPIINELMELYLYLEKLSTRFHTQEYSEIIKNKTGNFHFSLTLPVYAAMHKFLLENKNGELKLIHSMDKIKESLSNNIKSCADNFRYLMKVHKGKAATYLGRDESLWGFCDNIIYIRK